MLENWTLIIQDSLIDLWAQFLSFIPELVGAILIIIVGLIVATILERIGERILYYLRIDAALRKLGTEAYLERANIKLDVGHFVGKFIYWFIAIATILAASDVLGFYALSAFLGDVLLYIPNVIIAAFILLAALVAANFVRRLVVASINSAKLHHAKGIGTLVWWVIFIFGFLAALQQLHIATTIITAIISGIIAMMALAGGIAFGLGGRDAAKKFLEEIGREMR